MISQKIKEDKYREYLKNHIYSVVHFYDWAVEYGVLPDDMSFRNGLLNHDKSKYEPEEWNAYLEHFYGNVPSPDIDFNYAWLHHQNNNPHHWQYWTMIKDTGKIMALKIPRWQVYEMLCDWGSFSYQENDIKSLIR